MIEPARGRQAAPVSTSNNSAGVLAHELDGVAPLDQAETLGGQTFELDRLDLGAVLLGLAAALRLLVAVELGLDAVELAVEQVDKRPQQIGEIVFEPRAGQHHAQGLNRGIEMALNGVGVGQGARIGLVLARAIAGEGQFLEQMRGRLGGVPFGVRIIAVEGGGGAVVAEHGGILFAGFEPRHCGLRATAAGGGAGFGPEQGVPTRPLASGARTAATRRMAAGRLFCFALQSRDGRILFSMSSRCLRAGHPGGGK